MSSIVARVYRGELVESIHRGDWVVANAQGEIVSACGDPDKVTYWRSSAKPFQAIPVVESGAAQKFGFTPKEIAVMCASHSGEEYHTEAVARILAKIGLAPEALQCGIHPPVYKPAAERLVEAGGRPSEIHCNCSGKHSGMLALCQYYGWDVANYLDLDHPLQQLTLDKVSRYTGVPKEDIIIGIDGCGVPVFGLPIKNMTLAWARLVNPQGFAGQEQAAMKEVASAMRAHPEMVAGTDRLCTRLMRGFKTESLVAKAGAEAVYCVGLPEKGLGLAVKIEDGNSRAMPAVVLAILDKLGYPSASIRELQEYHPLHVRNHRNQVVGKIVPEVRE